MTKEEANKIINKIIAQANKDSLLALKKARLEGKLHGLDGSGIDKDILDKAKAEIEKIIKQVNNN